MRPLVSAKILCDNETDALSVKAKLENKIDDALTPPDVEEAPAVHFHPAQGWFVSASAKFNSASGADKYYDQVTNFWKKDADTQNKIKANSEVIRLDNYDDEPELQRPDELLYKLKKA